MKHLLAGLAAVYGMVDPAGRVRSPAHIPTQDAAQGGAVDVEFCEIVVEAPVLQAQMVQVAELLQQLVDVVAGENVVEFADRDEDVFRLDELALGGRRLHRSDLPRYQHRRTRVRHQVSYWGEIVMVRKRITSPARSRPRLRSRSLLSSRIIFHISPMPYFCLAMLQKESPFRTV